MRQPHTWRDGPGAGTGHPKKKSPTIGRLFSKHRFAYSYLPDSVSRFPETDVFMTIMEKAGFSRVTCRRLTLGIANLFMGVKPR